MFDYTTENNLQIIQLLAGRCNVFAVIASNKKVLVIDTSTRPNQKNLFDKLDELTESGAEIDSCLLTHTHFDHSSNANALVEAYDTSLYCHELEVPLALKGQSPQIQGASGFLKAVTTVFQTPLMRIGAYPHIVSPDRCKNSLDIMHIDGNLTVLHTPGHSDGSISVIVDGEVALVGDAMIGASPRGIYPPFALDRNAVLRSWQALLDTDCRIYLPSHGRPVTAELLYEQLQVELEK